MASLSGNIDRDALDPISVKFYIWFKQGISIRKHIKLITRHRFCLFGYRNRVPRKNKACSTRLLYQAGEGKQPCRCPTCKQDFTQVLRCLRHARMVHDSNFTTSEVLKEATMGGPFNPSFTYNGSARGVRDISRLAMALRNTYEKFILPLETQTPVCVTDASIPIQMGIYRNKLPKVRARLAHPRHTRAHKANFTQQAMIDPSFTYQVSTKRRKCSVCPKLSTTCQSAQNRIGKVHPAETQAPVMNYRRNARLFLAERGQLDGLWWMASSNADGLYVYDIGIVGDCESAYFGPYLGKNYTRLWDAVMKYNIDDLEREFQTPSNLIT